MSSLEEKVIRVITQQLEIGLDDIEYSSFLMDDLGCDPYDLEEIAGVLAEEFDIEIGEDDIESWESVADVIHYVSEKLED